MGSVCLAAAGSRRGSVVVVTSAPDVVVHVEDHAGPEWFDRDGELAHVAELLPDGPLALQRADDEQEAPAPGPRHLGAGGSCRERRLDGLVDRRVRDAGRQLALGRPALVERDAERVDVALAQTVRGLAGEVAQQPQLGQAVGDVRRLLAEDRVRAPRDAGEEEHQLLLHPAADLRGQGELVDDHAVARPEPDVADPAVRGGVLVLLADRLAAAVDLDGAGAVGKLLGGELSPLVGEQCLQQAHGHRGRRPEPGPRRRDVGQRRDLDAAPDPRHVHGLADELVLEVLHPRNDLLRGVVDVDVVVEPLLDDHVDVLVDGRVEHPAAVLAVVVGQVGAATDQADAQGRPRDDHASVLLFQTARAASSAAGVPMSAKNASPSGTTAARPTSRGSRSKPMSRGSGSGISARRAGSKTYRPALARSLVGCTGFSTKPAIRPPATSTIPQADGSGARKTLIVATAPLSRCASTSTRRSASVRLSALTARNASSPATKSRFTRSVPALPSSTGSWESRTIGGPERASTWARTRPARWWVLTSTSSTPAAARASSQMSSIGRPPISTRHFGTVSVIGRNRVPRPAASRKAFTRPPSGRRRGPASARRPRRARRRGRASRAARRRTPRPSRRGCAAGPTPAA